MEITGGGKRSSGDKTCGSGDRNGGEWHKTYHNNSFGGDHASGGDGVVSEGGDGDVGSKWALLVLITDR